MMGSLQNYGILCGPSGVALTKSAGKLRTAFDNQVTIRDLEEILKKLPKTEQALQDVGIGPSDQLRMLDITWSLSRSQVRKLWEEAASHAIYDLEKSSNPFKILVCHLIYYGGRRNEFYSPIEPSKLLKDSFKPSHILLLLDDVYDIYLRLTQRGEIFYPKDRVPSFLRRVVQKPKELSPTELVSLCWQWKVEVLRLLFSWREHETIVAENLAYQFGANFLSFGTKQLSQAAALWFKKRKPTSVYLSHPISRVRRKLRERVRRPKIIEQSNESQERLLEQETVCVLPTAIDELRFGSSEDGSPKMEKRWPVPAEEEHLLYARPEGVIDLTHEKILAFEKWNFEDGDLQVVDETSIAASLSDRIDFSLRNLERQIESQISHRDHLLVSYTDGILVFRPLIWDGIWSGGVEAEIDHWRILASTDEEKRAAFVHFTEDVERMIKAYQSEARASEIDDILEDLIASEFELSLSIARETIKGLRMGRASKILDKGLVPPPKLTKMEDKLPSFIREAKVRWLWEKLCREPGKMVTENQIAVWLLKEQSQLGEIYKEIADFFKGRGGPPRPTAPLEEVEIPYT